MLRILGECLKPVRHSARAVAPAGLDLENRAAPARRIWSFLRETSGATAITVAIAAPALLGMSALGVDVGLWYAERRALQLAADASAVAAARDKGHSSSIASLRQIARTEAVKNGFDDGDGAIEVNTPPTSGPNSSDTLAVEVVLSEPTALLFAKAVLSGPVILRTRAVAKTLVDNEFCLLALHPTLDRAVEFEGSADANFNCGVASNSSSESAFHLNGSARVTTTGVTTVGNYTATVGLDSATPPRPYSNPVRDPYSDLTVPPYSGCSQNSLTITTTVTLNPGVYCNGLRIESSARVTLNPGVYIVDRGAFYAAANARIAGSGVTFILSSSTGGNYGPIEIRGGARLDLTAPTSGPWAGVLFFQDRAAPSTITNAVDGSAAAALTGAIYAPSQEIRFAGDASLAAGCMQVIGRKLTITGSAQIPTNCAGTGVRPMGRVRIALVE